MWNSRQSEIFIRSDKITGMELDIMFSPLNEGKVIVEVYRKDSLMMKREYPAERTIVHIAIGAGATRIKFLNDIFVPAYKEAGSRDIRKLGVMLMSPVVIRKKERAIPLPLNRVISYKYATLEK